MNLSADWLTRFSDIPQSDQANENDQMESIFSLLSNDDSIDEYRMAAIVNPEETTIFLGLDNDGENFILLHNVEVVPPSRNLKKSIIRALHGFGTQATVVTMNYPKTMDLNSINCASLANIQKFAGHDKLVDSIPRTDKCQLKSRALIALPPFIANKLMRLPNLAIDTTLAIVLKIIADFDRKKQSAVTIVLDDPEAPSMDVDKPTPPVGLLEDPLEDSDDENLEASKIPKKTPKPTIFPKCQVLLRFLWTSAFQLKFPATNPKLPIVPITLTSDGEHTTWSLERHVRNSIGSFAPSASPSDARQASHPTGSSPELDHLARQSTTALVGINQTVQALFQEKQSEELSSGPVSKLHPTHLRMIRRLCSTNARDLRDPTDFFNELSSAPGKAGSGALITWQLFLDLKRWNIRVPNGCVTAIAKGIWVWTRATYPNNFSVFSFPRITASDYSKGLGDDNSNLHIRANHGRDLSEKDVKLLTNQGVSYTADVGETIKQLKNFSRCLNEIVHPDSMIAVNFMGLIKNIEDNEETYESLQAGNPLFCLQLLFKIDMYRNRLFHQCLIQETFDEVDWKTCDFYEIHSSVMNGNFVQRLPENHSIREANAKQKNQAHGSGMDDTKGSADGSGRKRQKQQKNPIRERENKGDFVPNTAQPSNHKLQGSENYGDLILKSKMVQHMPKLPDARYSICANYHIIGNCHSECQCKDSHKNLPAATSQALEEFLKKCRDNAQAKRDRE